MRTSKIKERLGSIIYRDLLNQNQWSNEALQATLHHILSSDIKSKVVNLVKYQQMGNLYVRFVFEKTVYVFSLSFLVDFGDFLME